MDVIELLLEYSLLIFTVLAVLINILTICAILISPKLRKKQNVFALNMALSDCVAAVVIFVRNLGILMGGYVTNWIEKATWMEPMFNAALLVSLSSVLAVALHRYIVFRLDPFGHRGIATLPRLLAVCFISWAFFTTTYLWVSLTMQYDFIGYFISPILIMACLVFTTICYALIYRAIALTPTDIGLRDYSLLRRMQKQKRVLVTFALIVGTSFACWFPMCIILLLEYHMPSLVDMRWFSHLSQSSFCLVALNGVINPMIYWIRLREFRGMLLSCCTRTSSTEQPVGLTDTGTSIRSGISQGSVSSNRNLMPMSMQK